ncbi:MAG: 2-amino-4-hydroxy-6-hydroxymethyldihydropteridine diphosphokinase [Caulobacteraceae bacterium]|nr:MAG: 2-amino-4-hydroxy-6-hydroxymethyldihydropteridine diphosphokinase [Caulobacteraceae bacterium]
MIVALGSNLPGGYRDVPALLEAALEAFPAHGLSVAARSGWWRSAAWPDPAMPAYTNGVVLVETALSVRETLLQLHEIEAAFGRTRHRANAPRTLDLDLIAHGRAVIGEGGLQVPHPRAHERRFVMGPLADVAPRWRHPVSGASAANLAVTATVGKDAARIPSPACREKVAPKGSDEGSASG